MFTCLQYFQTPLKFKEYVVARRFHNAPYPGIKKINYFVTFANHLIMMNVQMY